MTFSHSTGTRGARPPGAFMKFMNTLMKPMIRRNGKLGKDEVLLLTTVGRKSGQERTTPVMYFPDADGTSRLIVASAAGAATNPAWYHNLAAAPDRVKIEIAGKTIPVVAEQLHGSERDDAYRRIAAKASRFAGYETKTDRSIPVIRLLEAP